MKADASNGLLLPCSITVQAGEAGETLVRMVDPLSMLSAISNPTLGEVASEAAPV